MGRVVWFMWTEGQNPICFVDVINGWPLYVSKSLLICTAQEARELNRAAGCRHTFAKHQHLKLMFTYIETEIS